MIPSLTATVGVDASSVRVRYRIENRTDKALYVENVFHDKLPPNPLIELRPTLNSTTQTAYRWQCGPKSLLLYQGYVRNYTPISVYGVSSPFFSRVEAGSNTDVEIVLPRPLTEWDWCNAMAWPGGLTGVVTIAKIRLRVDTILDPEIVRALDGFPDIFPTARNFVPDEPRQHPVDPENEFRLRADLLLPEPLELRTYPRGGFIPIDEPPCE